MTSKSRIRPLVSLLLGLGALALCPSAFAQSAADADLDGVPDSMDAFPCDSGPSAVRFFPGQSKFATMFFEDQWPSRGDNDFNDVVLAYNFIITTNAQGQVYQIRVNYNAPAIGGVFNNGLALRLPVNVSQVASVTRQIGSGAVEGLNPETTDSELVVRVLNNVRELYDNQAGTINSDPALPTRSGSPVEVIIRFTQPVAMDLSRVPFDTFIFRTQNFGHQIHRPEYIGTAAMDSLLFNSEDDGSSTSRHFVDQSGLPFALLMPAATPWSREGTSISQLFPNITLFASSGGSQGADFYQSGVQLASAWTQGSNGQSAPIASFVGAPDEPGNGTCIVPWRTGGEQFGGTSNETTWQTFAGDSVGNIIVAGQSDGTIAGAVGTGSVFLSKFSSSGQPLWTQRMGGTSGSLVHAIAVDPANNIYVGYDQSVRKYSPAGALIWTTVPRSMAGGFPTAFAVAPDGNIIVTGGMAGSTGGAVMDLGYNTNWFWAVTSKLAANDGHEMWARGGDSIWSQSFGVSVVVDSAGNSYSYINHNMMNLGQSVIKRDPNGNLIYRVETDNQALAMGGQIRVSGDSVILTRTFTGTMNGVASKGNTDVSVQKIAASDGHQIWITGIGTKGAEAGNNGGSGYALPWVASPNDVDSAGNIYVAGTTNSAFTGFTSYGLTDYFVVKLNSSGAVQWTTQYGTAANDYGTGVAWEPVSNTLLVGGMTQGTFPGAVRAGGWDIFVMKHNPLTGGVL